MRIPYRIRKIFSLPGSSRARSQNQRWQPLSTRHIDPSDIRYDHSFILCTCCYQNVKIDEMVQCPEAHLFCKSCLKSHTEFAIGQGKFVIHCIDPSGCQAPFTDGEISKCVPETMIRRLETLRQQDDIRKAELTGYHACPFCNYGVCIEGHEESEVKVEDDDASEQVERKPRLFKCRGPGCGLTSCLDCGKKDHLPQTCAEAAERWKAKHELEEVKSDALIRTCPGCKLPFVRDMGCAMMTCTRCQALSCYSCKKPVEFNEDGTMKGDHTDCQTIVNTVEQTNVADAAKAYDEQRRKQVEIDFGKSFLSATLQPFRARTKSKASRSISNASGSSDSTMDPDEYIICDVPCWELLLAPDATGSNGTRRSTDTSSSDLDSECDLKTNLALARDEITLRRPSLEEFRGLALAYA